MQRSPTSAVSLRELLSLCDTQILQELLVTWRDGWTETFKSTTVNPKLSTQTTESASKPIHLP